MKVKIEAQAGQVLIAVQRDTDKKPVEVIISAADARVLASLLQTAAAAKVFAIEWEKP